MPKYGVISGPYFPVFGLNTEIYIFSPNTGKYGPGITPYLDTFHAVSDFLNILSLPELQISGSSFFNCLITKGEKSF